MTELVAPTSTSMRAVLDVSRADAELRDEPIPGEWVLEGRPHARISEWAESADGFTSHWTWECSAGRFRWYFPLDETIVVIDGATRIEVGGVVHCLGVGDAAYFPAGTWSVWEIEGHVRKHAVVRVPVPRGMRYVVKGFGSRLHRLR